MSCIARREAPRYDLRSQPSTETLSIGSRCVGPRGSRSIPLWPIYAINELLKGIFGIAAAMSVED